MAKRNGSLPCYSSVAPRAFFQQAERRSTTIGDQSRAAAYRSADAFPDSFAANGLNLIHPGDIRETKLLTLVAVEMVRHRKMADRVTQTRHQLATPSKVIPITSRRHLQLGSLIRILRAKRTIRDNCGSSRWIRGHGARDTTQTVGRISSWR